LPGELAIDDLREAQIVAFYSSFFLSKQEKESSLPRLFETLRKSSGDMAHLLMGMLSYLTGEEFGTSKEDWLDWWDKTRNK
jgi:hypothetical protein